MHLGLEGLIGVQARAVIRGLAQAERVGVVGGSVGVAVLLACVCVEAADDAQRHIRCARLGLGSISALVRHGRRALPGNVKSQELHVVELSSMVGQLTTLRSKCLLGTAADTGDDSHLRCWCAQRSTVLQGPSRGVCALKWCCLRHTGQVDRAAASYGMLAAACVDARPCLRV